MERIIVSRHRAAIEFIVRELDRQEWVHPAETFWEIEDREVILKNIDTSEWIRIPVVACATAEDVRGKIVYGTLPLHLAALAAEVHAIEFDAPPRGTEYSLTEMDAAGARIVQYHVSIGPRRHDADIDEEYISRAD